MSCCRSFTDVMKRDEVACCSGVPVWVCMYVCASNVGSNMDVHSRFHSSSNNSSVHKSIIRDTRDHSDVNKVL